MVGNQSEIPEGYDVHHIDGNKSNNSIYNLELIEHNEHMDEHHRKLRKKVGQFTLDGELVKIWESTLECRKNGFYGVADCCRGERKTRYGFIWKYID